MGLMYLVLFMWELNYIKLKFFQLNQKEKQKKEKMLQDKVLKDEIFFLKDNLKQIINQVIKIKTIIIIKFKYHKYKIQVEIL